MTILNQMAALLTQARSKTLKRHGWLASNTQVVGSISWPCVWCSTPLPNPVPMCHAARVG